VITDVVCDKKMLLARHRPDEALDPGNRSSNEHAAHGTAFTDRKT